MSWIKEPGEQVKLIRKKLTDLQDKLDRKNNPIVKSKHLEEINAVKNIFSDDSCEEFTDGHLDIEVIFKIDPILPTKELQASYVYENRKNSMTPIDFGSIFLEYLPAIKFYLKFPSTYPMTNPPEFTIDIYWLTPWELSRISSKLDQLWEKNFSTEILFVWIDFLKNHLFNYLGIYDKIDITFQFAYYRDNNDDDAEQLNEMIKNLRDSRVVKPVKRNPLDYFQRENQVKCRKQFTRVMHFCEICLEQNNGQHCIEVNKCRHVFCRQCLEEYFNSRISDGNVTRIMCPKIDCPMEIDYDEIKKLCNEKQFQKYEQLLLKRTIDLMEDTVQCARKYCGYPVIRENLNDNLATCAQCEYSFCVFCRKVYHGVSPCEMTSQDKEKLIATYQQASKSEKKMLQLRHGKRQIELVVEQSLTNNYLKENSKICPNCLTFTTRVDGCNKMTCSYCKKIFCWLCGKLINEKNSYEHFSKKKNGSTSCAGRLFDGLLPSKDFLNDLEIERNLEVFRI